MDTQENYTNNPVEPDSTSEPAAASTAPEIAEIAAGLNEPNIELLNRVADVLGIAEMQALYQRTQEIEAAGGMLTVRGNRRRTPGGVYFFLVKEIMTPEQEEVVFGDQSVNPVQPKRKPQPKARPEPPKAEQVRGLLATAIKVPAAQKGAAVMKATVIGRPKQIKKLDSCVMVVLGLKRPPVMPPGLPPIPDTSNATIAVFIADKQWPRVEQALRADPKDEIIAEGYPINDPKHQLTGFWAQSCTTKGLQRAKRTPRPYE
ncbi:MAG: hypothetical protein KAX65_10910 [Caldilineaceae bacterium]|nr:hypothetical protein [Caldilineaceae bacterium]